MHRLKGRGLDLSENPSIPGAEFLFLPFDGLFRPTAIYWEEFDFVYCRDRLDESRFFPIALHEFLALPKRGGLIVLEFTNAKTSTVDTIVAETKRQYKTRATLIERRREGKRHILIFKKKVLLGAKADSMNRWTFGIITRRGGEESLRQVIDSIRIQNIPECEIIVCGHTNLPFQSDIKMISFSKHDDKGWITRKKNLIAKRAKYENLCILHDHVALHPDWYRGFRRFGNYFDAVFLQSIVKKNNRADRQWTAWSFSYNSWMHKHWALRTYFDLGAHEELDKRDWSPYVGVPGYCTIMKKSVWKAVSWNEKLFWNQGEDYDLNKRLWENGYVIRLNPQSHIIHLKARWESFTYPFLGVRREFRSGRKGARHLVKLAKGYWLFFYENFKRKIR